MPLLQCQLMQILTNVLPGQRHGRPQYSTEATQWNWHSKVFLVTLGRSQGNTSRVREIGCLTGPLPRQDVAICLFWQMWQLCISRCLCIQINVTVSEEYHTVKGKECISHGGRIGIIHFRNTHVVVIAAAGCKGKPLQGGSEYGIVRKEKALKPNKTMPPKWRRRGVEFNYNSRFLVMELFSLSFLGGEASE